MRVEGMEVVALRRYRVGLVGLAAVMIMAVSASAANAVVVRLSNGRFTSVYLRSGLSSATYERDTGARPVTSAAAASSSPNGLLYNGGPVLHTSSPYLVFWDPSSAIPSRSRQVLTKYLTDAGLDSHNPSDVYAYRVLPQYTDTNGSAAEGQTFSSGTQAISDTDAYPAVDASTCTPGEQGGFAHCITDAQIHTELTHLITSDHLPSGTGANAPIYFVVTPQNVNVCINGGGGCARNTFCAYHSLYTPSGSTDVLYASIPFTLGAACQGAGLSTVQEPNGDVADVIADNLGHENAEAITDPLGSGWFTTNAEEVADQCEQTGPYDPNDPFGPTNPDAYLPTLGGSESAGTLYDQLINGDHYFTQTLWSNAVDNCLATAAVSASFTSSAPILPGVSASFDPAASSSNNGYSSTTWNWGDGSPNTVVAGPPTTASHTYTAPGTYTVTLTLVDGSGNTAQVRHTVVVDSPPTAAFSPSGTVAEAGAPVAFNGAASSDPNQGESIAEYSWSFGDGSPAGGGVAPSHVYASPGAYTVTLAVTGSDGLTAPVSHTVTVVAAPVAIPSLATRKPVAGSPVAFNGRLSTGGISAYAWHFGDSSVGSGATPRHIYAEPGKYTVTLTVTDPEGFTSTRSLAIVIAAPGKIKGWSVKRVKGKYYLVVTVTRAGTIRVRSAKATLKRPGKAKLKLSFSRAQLHVVAQHKTLSLKLKIIYTPAVGRAIKRIARVKVKP